MELFGIGGYLIWYPDPEINSFLKCDGVTDCSHKVVNSDYSGSVDDCAALCANLGFTNFPSSKCYKALVFTDSSLANCNLLLWDAVTKPYDGMWGAAVLSDCAFPPSVVSACSHAFVCNLVHAELSLFRACLRDHADGCRGALVCDGPVLSLDITI